MNVAYQSLLELTGRCEDEVVDLTRQLVGISSPSFGEEELAQIVEQKMWELGYDKVLVDAVGNVVGLLFGNHPGDSVLFISNMDTLAVSNQKTDSLSNEPGLTQNNRIHGPGAACNKSALAVQLMAGALLKRARMPLRGNVIVAATVAEQGGLGVGVRDLLNHTLPTLGMKPSLAVLGGPTSLNIYNDQDGWMQMDVRLDGTNLYRVQDAAFAVVKKLRKGSSSGFSVHRGELLSVQAPVFRNFVDLSRAVIPLTVRVPRGTNALDAEWQIRDSIAEIVKPLPGVVVETNVHQEERCLYNGRTATSRYITFPWSMDPCNKALVQIRTAFHMAECNYHLGSWQFKKLGMGYSGSVLIDQFGIPTVGYGPGCESVAQATNEYVETDKLARAVYGTAVIANATVGSHVLPWTSKTYCIEKTDVKTDAQVTGG